MQLSTTIFYICVIAIVISCVGTLALTYGTASEKAAHTRPELYDRLAPKLRNSEIYALSSEDHYVRVFTAAGEEMIFMRLSDAVKETKPLTGVAPHRSWWVSEVGVESVNRKNGKIIISLKNGVTVPVSRNGSKTVKEAGWI